MATAKNKVFIGLLKLLFSVGFRGGDEGGGLTGGEFFLVEGMSKY